MTARSGCAECTHSVNVRHPLYVCCSGCDGTVRLWSVTPLTSGTPLYVCCSGCDGTVRLWSPTPLTSGTPLYVCCSGCDGTVRLWSPTPLTSGTPLYVCCSGCDGTVRLWSPTPLTSGTPLYVCCSGCDGTVRLWSVGSSGVAVMEQTLVFHISPGVFGPELQSPQLGHLCWGDAGSLIAVCMENTINIWTVPGESGPGESSCDSGESGPGESRDSAR